MGRLNWGFLVSSEKRYLVNPRYTTPFQKAKAYTNASSLVLELSERGSMKICKECTADGLFTTDVLESYSIMLELSQVIIEYLKFFLFCKCFL